MSTVEAAGPRFVSELDTTPGGVDHLGLRQVNLDLIGLCLPGINNVTSHVRPYALLSWIHWKLHDLALASAESSITEDDIRRFSERVETLFTWGHVRAGVTGVPGVEAKPPAVSESGRVSLRFADWNRRWGNTSLMAAVQYGPSTKTGNGLGLLEPLGGGAFRARGVAVGMARCMDERLRATPAYALLDTLAVTQATGEQADALFGAWDVRSPSPEELAHFRQAYLASDASRSDAAAMRRRGTLELVQQIQRLAPGVSLGALRRIMAHRRLPPGKELELNGLTLEASRRWLCLQLRQAQRLALELLMGWLERQLVEGRVTSCAPLARKLAAVLPSRLRGRSVGEVTAGEASGLDDEDSLRAALTDGGSWPMFADCNAIESKDTAPDEAAVLAVMTLLRMPGAHDALWPVEDLQQALRHGGAERISLAHWAETAQAHAERGLEGFLHLILENHILSQHLGVAARRLQDKRPRLRLSIEDTGLKLLAARPWRPQRTPDRLHTALSLLAECGGATGRAEPA